MKKEQIKTLKNISTGLVLIAIVFAFLISGIRILGFQVFGVLTGSMEPTYPTGSLIYVKPVNSRDLRVNDVITFSISPNVIATHRIVELVPDEEIPSIVRFRTKGDANDVVDASLVSESNIIGKVYFCVPHLGNLASYIQEPPGIYVAILVCILMIAFVFYTDSLESGKKKGQNGSAAANSVDVAALVNKVSQKLLGKPIMKAKSPKPQAVQPNMPQQPVQQEYAPAGMGQQPYYGNQPQYQQGYVQQPQFQQQFSQQPAYQQPQYQQPQFQQPQFQQPQFQQPQYQQPQYQQPQYQQPQYQQPQYQQPQYQQPQFQQNVPVQQPAPMAAQPQQSAPKSYPTMFNQPQQNAPRRRSQRNNG